MITISFTRCRVNHHRNCAMLTVSLHHRAREGAEMGALAQLLPLVRSPRRDQDQSVLSAALQAFLDFGIKRTSMVEVARRGGLSLATLYRRFSSKSDLIQAVGLQQTREFIEGVDAAVQRQIDRDAGAEDQIVELFVRSE